MSIPREDLTIKLGDIKPIPMVITGPNSLPLDLSDDVVQMRVWEEGQNVDIVAPFTLTSETLTAGVVNILLGIPEQSSLVARGPKYWYDIQLTGGPTVLEGRLYVEPDRVR